MVSGTVVASVDYIRSLPIYEREKPFQIHIPIPQDAKDQRTTNIEFETRQQTFFDMRHRVKEFTLDKNGFEIIQATTSLTAKEASDQNVIESIYLPEVEALLSKHIPGSFDRIMIFDWRVRDASTSCERRWIDLNDKSEWLRPVDYVHIDQAPRAVVERTRLFMGDEADFLLQGRVRMINVWRPIEKPVKDFPLAFCNASSLDGRDLIECDVVRKYYKGATIYPRFNPEQRFYYLGDQTPEEVALLKIFDSDANVEAKACAHCSFSCSEGQMLPWTRKSIEVRALVFNYPKQ